jgi:hypothetical protein
MLPIGTSKYIAIIFYSAATQAFYNVEKPDAVGNWQAIIQFQVIF